MVNDVLVMVKAALDDATWGVNRCLAAIPNDGGDPATPTIVKVLTEVDDDTVATGNEPDDWPVLVVTSDAPARLVPEVESRGHVDVDIPLAIRYFSREQDEAATTRDAWRTVRAVQRCLRELTRQANTDLTRTRNGIWIVAMTSLFSGLVGDSNAPRLKAAVGLELRVRDQAPYYTV